MFCFNAPAARIVYNFTSLIREQFGKDIVLKGLVAAFKGVDAATDMKIAFFGLVRASKKESMWVDAQQD
jgi:hypothetical protein